MSKIFENIKMQVSFAEELKEQIERLKKTRTKYGEELISHFKF